MVCKDAEIKNHLVQAGEEETDHLIWCKKRLEELNGKPSILNPVWYAGSFAIGAIFGSFGEKTSLGFVEETEKQVVKHLEKHSKTQSYLIFNILHKMICRARKNNLKFRIIFFTLKLYIISKGK